MKTTIILALIMGFLSITAIAQDKALAPEAATVEPCEPDQPDTGEEFNGIFFRTTAADNLPPVRVQPTRGGVRVAWDAKVIGQSVRSSGFKVPYKPLGQSSGPLGALGATVFNLGAGVVNGASAVLGGAGKLLGKAGQTVVQNPKESAMVALAAYGAYEYRNYKKEKDAKRSQKKSAARNLIPATYAVDAKGNPVTSVGVKGDENEITLESDPATLIVDGNRNKITVKKPLEE